MAGAALLLLAVALVACAAAFTTALLQPRGAVDAAVAFGVVAAAGVAAAILLTGAAGQLRPASVLVLHALWAVAAGALVARRGVPLPRPRRIPAAALRRHPWVLALVSLATLALGWQLLVALVLPPFAYDGITYHLTIVATWLQQGSLDPTPLSLCCARYPASAELMFAWPALFLGSDALVDAVQLPFALLAAAAVAGLARSAGLSRAMAAAGAALFVMTPIVLVQIPTNYADVILAAAVLASLHALVRFAATVDSRHLAIAGLAAGLALGVKGTGVLWGLALLGSGGLLVVALRRWRRVEARTAWRGLAALVLTCAALGSYWYARNWVDTGNPLYPFQVEVAGTTIFDGPFAVGDVLTRPDPGHPRPEVVEVLRAWAADVPFWRRGSYDYQERQGGLGPLWPWLGLPLLVPLTVYLLRRRSPALLAVAAVAAVTAVQPYAWWSRFTIPLAAMGVLAVLAAAAWAPRRWMRRGVQVAAAALAAIGVALASLEVDPAASARALPARDVLGLIGAPPAERSLGRLFFDEYRFLERVPRDATIAVDLRAAPVRFVYPLFGARHEREVVPAGSAVPREKAWVVTGAGRPLDRALQQDKRFRLAFSARGLHAWEPRR